MEFVPVSVVQTPGLFSKDVSKVAGGPILRSTRRSPVDLVFHIQPDHESNVAVVLFWSCFIDAWRVFHVDRQKPSNIK